MNPLHQRTTGGAPAASGLVPEAHGYGFIAASEVTANVQSEAPNVQSPACTAGPGACTCCRFLGIGREAAD